MQCLARTQQLEKRVTCGVSRLVRLARAGRCDPLTRGVALGLSGEVPMAVSAFTISKGDGNSRGKAEEMLLREEDEGEGLLEVSAVAPAFSSAGEASTSKGEEKCWLVIGAPLRVTCNKGAHFASDCSVAARHHAHVTQVKMQELQLACSTRHA